ncbi:hypothetical protein Patl1_21951 [Pistacia atlantica]|uniref:Uncharacterized protein n=1 Tax=Pistacia atlantica TaxID=434234 RepID=A0ACC1BJD3_9ROSI|nr:hypothetical protein Patl1_21951 [Pistacia atlantica]
MECLLKLSYGLQVSSLLVLVAGPLLVLGEYGAADGKFSATYSTGKLRDVAEAYSKMKLLRYHYFLGKFGDGHIVYLLPGSL